MDQLEQAMANLEQTMAQLRSFPVLQPQTDFSEIDDQRSVEVIVDEAGNISAIKVLNGWEDRIPTEELTGRINQILARAMVRAMGIDPDDDYADLPDLSDEQLPTLDEATSVTVSADDKAAAAAFVDERYAEFVEMVEYTKNHQEEILEDIQRRFDELDSVLTESPMTEKKRYYSENRMVSLTSDGAGIGDVQISESWLKGSRSGLTITQCLTEALQQAPQASASFAEVMNLFKF